MKVNNKIKEQIISLLKGIYNKLYDEYISTLSLYLDKPILEQILAIIGNKDNYDNLLEKMNSTNMNDIIINLSIQREDYFFDKDMLNKIDKEISQKIPDLEAVIFK